MKNILIFFLLLISFCADAQVKQKPVSYGIQYRRVQADSAMRIPTVQVGIKDSYAGFDTAQIRYNKSDSSVQTYTGSQWIALRGASGSGWAITGNSGITPSTNFLGTTDAAALRLKVDGYDAGFMYNAGFGGSGIVPDYTDQYTTYGQLAGYTLTPLVIAGSSTGRSNHFDGSGAGAWVGATIDTTAGSVSDANTFIGLFSGGFTQRTSFVTGTGRNVYVGMSTGFHNLSPGENTGVGTFVLESSFRPTKNSAYGSNALRTGNDALGMTAIGAYASALSGTIISSVTINSSSSDWTTATATFSAPWNTGSPGDCRVTATGTVTIAGGQITGIVITNPGCGYTDITGHFSASLHNTRPIVTITGDGTSVSATVNTLSATNSSSLGHTAGWLVRSPQNMLYLGSSSEPSTRYWDAYGGAIGYQAGVHSSISALQKITNGWAIGTNAKVSTDRTLTIGAPSGDTTLKVVINNHTGDSTFSVYTGGAYIERGFRVGALTQSFTGFNVPMVNAVGSFSNSIITQDAASAIVRIDDNVRGVTTTNAFPLIVRNSYAGDATSNADPLVLFSTNSSSSTQKYIMRMTAINMPDASKVSYILGKTATAGNAFLWTYHHAGSNNNGNYLEHQFHSVPNLSRVYRSGSHTWGSGVSADNGYLGEFGGKVRINDSLWVQGGVRFTGLTNFSDTTNFKPIVYNTTSGELYKSTYWPGGGGGTPAGNFGNVQINRNGAFATPGSDSLDFESATGLTVKGGIRGTTLGVNIAAPTATYAANIEGDATYPTMLKLSHAGTPTAFLELSSVYGTVHTWGSLFQGSELLITQAGGTFRIAQGARHLTTWTQSLVNVNGNNNDVDFVVEGQTDADLIRADASTDRVGIGVTSPLAKLHLAAGTASANTGPLKFSSGTILTTAEAGVTEYNGTHYLTKASGLRYATEGTIADHYTDVNNGTTVETDIYTYTTPASTLANDGEKIFFTYTLNLNDVTATANIKVYFAGTAIATTGALTVSSTGAVIVQGWIVRTAATTARASVNISSPTASTAVYTAQTDLTGLTLSGTNIIKVTAQAGGAGGGSNDITGKSGTVSWRGAAAN